MNTRATRRPPGPKGLPLLGNMLEFSRDILRYYSEWSRDYGDIVSLNLAGWPVVLLNNPDYAEYVLVRNHRNFIKFPLFFRNVRAIFGEGLLTSEGEFWHRQRRLAAPAFHAQRVAGYGDVMVRDTERMLAGWRAGELRDVHTDMMAVTLRIAAKTLFNAEVDRDVADIGQAFDAIAGRDRKARAPSFAHSRCDPDTRQHPLSARGAPDRSAGEHDHQGTAGGC